MSVSYRQFRDTLPELQECRNAIDDLINVYDGPPKPLSNEEYDAAQEVVSTCVEILNLLLVPSSSAMDDLGDEAKRSLDRFQTQALVP